MILSTGAWAGDVYHVLHRGSRNQWRAAFRLSLYAPGPHSTTLCSVAPPITYNYPPSALRYAPYSSLIPPCLAPLWQRNPRSLNRMFLPSMILSHRLAYPSFSLLRPRTPFAIHRAGEIAGSPSMSRITSLIRVPSAKTQALSLPTLTLRVLPRGVSTTTL